MRVRFYPPMVYDADVTSETVAKHLGIAPEAADTHQLHVFRAGTCLVRMFEQGMARVNQKRLWAGWPTAIRVRRDQGARCYYCPGQHGVERTLWLSIALPLRDGHLFGGAYIKFGGAQKAIYVMSAVDTEPTRWLVQSSGAELTPSIVDDLFQAAFSDDADAATRLAPLYGFDLFATPWS
jgi:hypothetical protein